MAFIEVIGRLISHLIQTVRTYDIFSNENKLFQCTIYGAVKTIITISKYEKVGVHSLPAIRIVKSNVGPNSSYFSLIDEGPTLETG